MNASGKLAGSLPDSIYAQELRRDAGRMEFSPEIESRYRSFYLSERRTHVRSFYVILLLISAASALLGTGAASIARLMGMALIFAALVAVINSSKYQRMFLPFASACCVVVSLLGSFEVASHIASGNGEAYAVLTTFSLALYYLAGLLFSAALYSNLALIAGFAAALFWFGLPLESVAALTAFLAGCAVIGGLAFRNHGARFRRSFLQHCLIEDLASLDGLTGLKNRRAFDDHMVLAWQQALRSRGQLAVLLMDVDHFKRYNDRYGHQAGDAALRQIASVAREFTRRPLDIAARYGGEEFALVLYDVQAGHLEAVAEQLRLAVQRLDIEHEDSAPLRTTTISIGAAIVSPSLGRTPHGLIQLADEALYASKRDGRNRVTLLESEYSGTSTGEFRPPEAQAG